MGSLMSKKAAKVAPAPTTVDPRKVSSAPATLQNQAKGLEETSPSLRAITPPEATISTPSPSGKAATQASPRVPSKCNSMPRSLVVSEAPASPSTSLPAPPTPSQHSPSNANASNSAAESPNAAAAAAKHGPKKIDVIGDQSDGKKLAADLPAAITIPDDAQAWTRVYGESVVRNFHSQDWKDRENSLASIARCLGNAKFLASKDPQAVYSATAEMLAKTLKDKVAPIFHASLELVSLLLASFSSSLSQTVLRASMDPILPVIVHRCGNLNTRIHESSLQALLAVAGFPAFGCAYVGPFALAEPPKRNRDASQAAQMYGRLDLVCSLLAAFKTTAGLPLVDVMKFCKQGLENADEKVRGAAIKVIVEMYKLQKASGSELQLEKHLGLIKPALMQVLQKKFAEADADATAAPSTSGAGAPGDERVAASSGIKVYGKSLPPIGRAPGMAGGLVVQGKGASASGGADSPAGPLSPALRGRSPLGSPAGMANKRERARMGTPPLSPPLAAGSGSMSKRSPLAPLTELERTASPSTPGARRGPAAPRTPGAGGLPSPAGGLPSPGGVLDDAEEQLIQYIMGDEKMQ